MANHHDPAFGNLDSIAALRTWAQRIVEQQRAQNFEGGCRRGSLAAELVESADALAYSLLAATQGGYLLTQAHRDAYALEAALGAAIDHIESLAIEASERSTGYLGSVGRARSQ
jgi:TetR/AcrR family transcriptional repressor of nem operon